MKLTALLERLFVKQIKGDTTNIEITNIAIDSRKIKPDGLFICLTGTQMDGHQFITEAISNGAISILVEIEVKCPPGVTLIHVPDTRRAMAIISDYYYGQCSNPLKLIGITGTNGKTTTTHLIEKMLSDNGKKAGLIGTLYTKVGDFVEKTVNTTPEAIEIQRYFNMMLELKAQYAVLEVSSHSLEMGRVRGCNFKTAVFTNLTHDHLDYHQTLENYLDAKSLLFSQMGNTYTDEPKFAVLNADDPASKNLAKKSAVQVLTYGIEAKADVQARDIELRTEGTFLTVDTLIGSMTIHLKLLGKFNVYNALAAISVGIVEHIPLEGIKKSLEAFHGVDGRFQPVFAGQNFSLIVDYAHNPNGLENVLKTARELTKGKLYCVVGCEGDRDKFKRPIMGNIAVTYSDKAIFTSDNPRSENPNTIINDILEGLRSNNISEDRYITIPDRREAIRKAIEFATDANDCIIIAGKGHETHQIIKNEHIPFNDIEVAVELICTMCPSTGYEHAEAIRGGHHMTTPPNKERHLLHPAIKKRSPSRVNA
ncbi:UDP-N-acetylmuramoyl-L-alanyl-D-glutamate--2,6-diaminopimelate ligase [Paenibacillus sp. V4I5]|uniref:UDP-N-acetylmuramoyl-L-alanyl-D-glutamate--2, 6-diaminopimelate ligase n=1 Tax=Paenibacillus sp. V4I5 TaxID=3042306 RepID=UPI00278D5089|nr:UDP-N-acetylmuramoyl-L-alanyl-D-glutamate--2,6-diaminopimelate ligase [Paenibacillus sp. V4I5]MDQ0920574.1 UDP-N-acetylmuramoyl-L-alanyl-D-glutamate--2,6-diaminopimelate ligase [Paenibacillus sp. V4I5]